MKLFKRFTALVLAGVMTLGLLTGCATNSNTYGDIVTDLALQQINSMRYWESRDSDDEQLKTPVGSLENDRSLKKELRSMLSKIDEDGYIMSCDAIQYKEKLNANGRLDGTYKMVITYETGEWVDHFFRENEYSRARDDFEDRELRALDFWYSDEDEEELLDMLEEFYELSPYMSEFAIEYTVINDGVVYFAVGFTVKNAPSYLIPRHPDPNRPNTDAPLE